MSRIFVTGGAGFIGSNFVRYWLAKHPKDSITVLDLFTYAGDKNVLKEFSKEPRVKFIKGNICDQRLVTQLLKDQDAVFHFAAESHVDRSILDSQIFLKTNVLGTHALLEAARENKTKRFMFVSTDEVYGSIEKGFFREDSPLEPNSPYAVSKASADLLCRAYWITHKLPVTVTRCSNNYGPYHFPEKVIPLFITNLIEGKKVPIYGKGLNVREWIYVMDHCSGIEAAYLKGAPGEVYNLGSGVEMTNLELAKRILAHFGCGEESIEYVQDRLGHDLRYAIDSSKIRKLGWKPAYDFKKALEETVRWYRQNKSWWSKLKHKSDFQKYLKKNYRPAGSK